MRMLVTALVAVIGVTAPTAAHAQYTNPYTGNPFDNPGSSLVDTIAHDGMLTNTLLRYLTVGSSTETDGVVGGRPERRPIKASDFKPSKKRLMKGPFLDSITADAAQREAVSQMIDDAFKTHEAQARKNNVAYALAFLVAASTQVTTGNEIFSDTASDLAADINDVIAADKRFKKMKAKQRQQLYETCVITGGLVLGFRTLAARTTDTHMSLAVQQLAAEVLGRFGVK